MRRKNPCLQSYFIVSIKTGCLSLIRAILYRATTVSIKQTHVPAVYSINNRLNFGGNFAAAHSDGILTSSVTTSTINKQCITPSANQITAHSGSLETTLNTIFQSLFKNEVRAILSLFWLFRLMEPNINEEQFTQIVEHLTRIDKSRDKTFYRLQRTEI